MSSDTYVWQNRLLSYAAEGWRASAGVPEHPARDCETLDRAYRHCEFITAAHSRSFHLASALLPADKRRAVRALYAFCRVTDDIVDRPGADAATRLNAWRLAALGPEPPGDDLVAVAWADARARYAIPVRYAEQLFDGVARDIGRARYATFEDLATYCYGVASTVGLMSMHIVGYAGPDAVPYAVKLGVALQLTNILRDVGEDLRSGRLYLPQDELAAYGLYEHDLVAGRLDGRWRAFMRFQIARARRLYAEVWPGIGLLAPNGRLAIAAAADLYRAILADIEARDYDVFTRRAHLGTWAKLRRLPGLWWQTRRLGGHRSSVKKT